MGAVLNFFKLYIGDYQRDTAHLSITEHGAYMLMLQHYYATEKPLPVGKALHRMLRAQDKAEREAIDAIAAQFWATTDSGLVNGRADKERAKSTWQAETNRATAIAREAARKEERDKHEQSTNRATKGPPRERDNHSHSQTPETPSESSKPPPSSEVPVSSLRSDPAPTAFDGENLKALNGKAVVTLAAKWELPEEWGVDAEALGWQPREVLLEAEKFRQFWTAGKGAGKRKSVRGWRQSWSNWLGKAAEMKR